MAPMDFQGLPLDIVILIINYVCYSSTLSDWASLKGDYQIIRPTDMKNLCLVSKNLRSLTTPQLYRNVALRIGSNPDRRLFGFLHSDNPGLPYVRSLRLDEEDDANGQQALFVVHFLLDLLPKNILTEFTWRGYVELTVDIVLLLYRQQSGLLELGTLETDRPLSEIIYQAPEILDRLDSVKRITIHLHNIDSLYLGAEFLKIFPDIDTLEIGDYTSDEFDSLDLQAGTKLEPVTGSLFQHMLPFNGCSPMRLRSLTLYNLDLQDVATTLIHVIDLSFLERLKLEGYQGTRPFLQTLTDAYSNLRGKGKLTALEIIWVEQAPDLDPTPLDDFLVAIPKGLTSLAIFLKASTHMPKVASLTHHGASLKSLLVMVLGHENRRFHFTPEEFGEMCWGCRGLEQLSIMLPLIRLDLSEDRLQPKFAEFIRLTGRLPYLHTLNITSSPYPESNESDLIPLHHYNYLLRELARRIYEARESHFTDEHRQSKLTVLAIGADNINLPDGRMLVQGSVKRMHYLRAKQTDMFGHTSVTSSPIESHLVKYAAPASDILDFRFP
ncbi:MAG: hypothetical protein M1812_002906 [Candelaria pacifica]|nr:MAG: hypothetical protein M1812_002906 [Candelaria pacifica]